MTNAIRPADHRNVMATRREPPDSLDYFPTPPWAARAGAELIQRIDPHAVSCWEPACGEGHMAWALQDYFGAVLATDIFDYGQGRAFQRDFLDAYERPDGVFDWVITNPPFVTAGDFIRAGLAVARRGVAMLCRLSFLESVSRYPLLFGDRSMQVLAPCMERVPMAKGRWDPKGSTATAYAWFIWLQPTAPGMEIPPSAFIHPLIIPIAPGARDRLHREADVRRFCQAPDAGALFQERG